MVHQFMAKGCHTFSHRFLASSAGICFYAGFCACRFRCHHAAVPVVVDRRKGFFLAPIGNSVIGSTRPRQGNTNVDGYVFATLGCSKCASGGNTQIIAIQLAVNRHTGDIQCGIKAPVPGLIHCRNTTNGNRPMRDAECAAFHGHRVVRVLTHSYRNRVLADVLSCFAAQRVIDRVACHCATHRRGQYRIGRCVVVIDLCFVIRFNRDFFRCDCQSTGNIGHRIVALLRFSACGNRVGTDIFALFAAHREADYSCSISVLQAAHRNRQIRICVAKYLGRGICGNRNIRFADREYTIGCRHFIVRIIAQRNLDNIGTDILTFCTSQRVINGISAYQASYRCVQFGVSFSVDLSRIICCDSNCLRRDTERAAFHGHRIVRVLSRSYSDRVLADVLSRFADQGVGDRIACHRAGHRRGQVRIVGAICLRQIVCFDCNRLRSNLEVSKSLPTVVILSLSYCRFYRIFTNGGGNCLAVAGVVGALHLVGIGHFTITLVADHIGRLRRAAICPSGNTYARLDIDLSKHIGHGRYHSRICLHRIWCPDDKIDHDFSSNIVLGQIEHAAIKHLDIMKNVIVCHAAQTGSFKEKDRLIPVHSLRIQERDTVIAAIAAVRTIQAKAVFFNIIQERHAVVSIPITVISGRFRFRLICGESVFHIQL